MMLNPKGRVVTWTDISRGLAAYFLSGLVIILGLAFGTGYVGHRPAELIGNPSLLHSAIRYDGHHYRAIAVDGYSYDPNSQSLIAFFPAYPMLVRVLVFFTGLDVDLCLILVSNAALLVSFVLIRAYARHRYPENELAADATLLVFSLLPSTFFFRMAYSEGLFLCFAVLTLLAMERCWSPWIVAVLTGALCGIRPVGIAMLPVFLIYACTQRPRSFRDIARVTITLSLASWGLSVFIAYQWYEFGEPFAFAKTQRYWVVVPPVPFFDKAIALLTFEPIRDVYDPSSTSYWARMDKNSYPFFSLTFLNPIFFLFTILAIAGGFAKGWLSRAELILGIGLIAIPYFTKGYDFAMLSSARFAAVAIPFYLVNGRLLSGYSPLIVGLLAGISALFLACFTALFSASFPFF